jgi:hypothetical protein
LLCDGVIQEEKCICQHQKLTRRYATLFENGNRRKEEYSTRASRLISPTSTSKGRGWMVPKRMTYAIAVCDKFGNVYEDFK